MGITADTNPTLQHMNEQLFERSWTWLAQNGYVGQGDDAREYARRELEKRGWPVPSSAMLLDLFSEYTAALAHKHGMRVMTREEILNAFTPDEARV